ncbi:hypothetical protein DMUE_5041 [Dictyocoela muelleri]|nr:hypothetical protein DMUE_5041 [Dictyocoela muelleri]
MKIIRSRKGNKKIVFKNYICNIDRECSKFISWRCVRRDCQGRLRTSKNLENIISKNDHWHEEETARITRIDMNQKLHEYANDTNENFEYSLNKTLSNLEDGKKQYIGNYSNIRDYFKKLCNKK